MLPIQSYPTSFHGKPQEFLFCFSIQLYSTLEEWRFESVLDIWLILDWSIWSRRGVRRVAFCLVSLSGGPSSWWRDLNHSVIGFGGQRRMIRFGSCTFFWIFSGGWPWVYVLLGSSHLNSSKVISIIIVLPIYQNNHSSDEMGLYPLLAILVLTMMTIVMMIANATLKTRKMPTDNFSAWPQRFSIWVGAYITSTRLLSALWAIALTPMKACFCLSSTVILKTLKWLSKCFWVTSNI